MNTWIKRVSIAVASTALAGGAVLGAAVGPAAASEPSRHAQSSAVAFAAGSDRVSHREDGYGGGHHRLQEQATARTGISAERWYLDQVAWTLHQH
ncbi:hypothetical protein [Streptomyces sp. NPDC059224]|uniref:hypothetical protein n=1 Tax=Streptomyces sp. NPDC059224 TaxID=3346775 RepID=UPI0036C1DA32